MDNKKYTYISIPLPFIRTFLVTPRRVKDVVKYTVYLTAYNWMRNASNKDLYDASYASITALMDGEKMPYCIKNVVMELFPALVLSDENVQRLQDYAETTTELCNNLLEWYAVRMECNRFGIMMDDVDTYRNIFWGWNKSDPDVTIFASVRVAVIQRYLRRADKADIPMQERAQMACYLALKSIIGREAYTCASQDFILARMLGCRDMLAAADFLRNTPKEELRQMYEKYSLREQFNKLLQDLLRLRFLRCCIYKKENGTHMISTKLSANEIAERESSKLSSTPSIKQMTKTYYRTIKQKQK